MRRRGETGLVATAAALLVLAVPAGAQEQEPEQVCGETAHPAGEWPSYGGDLTNSRTQPLGEAIGPDSVASLGAAWTYAAPGAINNTPIVTGGCVFVASSDGTVAALDADDGSTIWSTSFDPEPSAFGGGIVGSPAVTDDSVIAAINKQGAPFLVSVDRTAGAERWRTTIDDQPSSGINASVVVNDGLAFIGFFGNAGPGTHERGGFALVDVATGELVKKTYVIDDASFEEGYAGAGIWGTPAFDTEAGVAYVGTSNPHSPEREHERANSLLKIDVRAGSPTFGEILDSYKGRPDTFIPGAADQPACETAPDVYYVPPFSATCVQVDLDFGASPTLFEDAAGSQRLGGLQKSGDFHVLDPADMTQVWRQTVGIPCLACNAASPASAGGNVFTAAGPPGQLFILDGESGQAEGAGVLTGPTTYNAVSVSNGVIYVLDSAGFMNAFDAANGVQLAKRRLEDDTGESMVSGSSASGIAVARDTLFVAAAGYLIALRPGADAPGGGPAPPEAPSPPGAGATIATAPGAASSGLYLPPSTTTEVGGEVTYMNADAVAHDITSDATTGGQPLFSTPLLGFGESAPIEGLENVEPGETYGFYCSLHTNMRGELVIR